VTTYTNSAPRFQLSILFRLLSSSSSFHNPVHMTPPTYITALEVIPICTANCIATIPGLCCIKFNHMHLQTTTYNTVCYYRKHSYSIVHNR
jgi:Rps23 Pro-64 3,4-dihydroxylase Tpa1-like proline 4-hydroxylase